MKKLFPVGMLLACSSVAHAQNTVTLYGIIDEGLDYTNNVDGHSLYEMQSGYVQGSRFGLKGAEDLGGGLTAVFRLENGFNVNNGKLGQGGRMFGRQAYVGLGSTSWGTVTAGRQYDSVVDYVGPLTANGNWAGYLFAHPSDNDNTDNSFRIDNSVKYTSVNYRGLQFGTLYGFSNQAGGFADNRAFSVGAQYVNGPLQLGAAFMNVDNPANAASAANSSIGAVTYNDGSFAAARQRIFGAGINYTVGQALLGFVYTHTDLSQPTADLYVSGSIGTPSSLKFDNFEVNVKYQVTPMMFVGAMYTYTQGTYDGASRLKPKWNELGLMADYNFSKRTDVYLQGAYQKVSGDLTGAPGIDNAYIPGAADSSSNRNQAVVRVALRHKF